MFSDFEDRWFCFVKLRSCAGMQQDLSLCVGEMFDFGIGRFDALKCIRLKSLAECDTGIRSRKPEV